MAAKKKIAKRAKKAKKAVKKKPAKKAKKAVKKKPAKKAKKAARKKSVKRAKKKTAKAGKTKMSLAERRRSLRRRRRTIRLQQATSSLTNVHVLAGTASKTTQHTHTRIIRKRENIGMLPIDKNVMIKALVEAGSIDALAKRFGTTKQAIGSWFGRRGLQAIDVVDMSTDRKKEII